MENDLITKVNPGDTVPGGFSYPNNAKLEGGDLQLRDASGNVISGSSVREGYITNDINIVKYLKPYNWKNGSTSETVYLDSTGSNVFGSLNPNEKATLLYKKDSRYHVVYDTSDKGAFSKSGYVNYHGGVGNSESGSENINPGDIVPGGFTYNNNAIIENDFLYLRDANGNQIPGRTVSIGDKITVLDISYSKQLALIQYPTSSGVRQGYVTNTTNIITYLNPYNWFNGSTSETVYLESTGSNVFGTINAYEAATLLYKKGNRYHIVYDTSVGMLTKSGYVDFKGLDVPPSNVIIPNISINGVEKIQYGTSGKGRALNAYKIGNGSKVLFAGFAIHGFEDNWFRDGEALVKIATELVHKFASYNQSNGLHGWTVYIGQCINPDGVIEGVTNNGPGRCAVTTGIDMNRCFPTGFVVRTESRYKTGPSPLGAVEAVALKKFIENIHSKASEMVVIDGHGWLSCTYGNSTIASYFTKQFGFSHNGAAGGGFLARWAESLSGTRAILLEYPSSTRSYNDVINGNYIGKTYTAMLNIMKNNPGTGGDTGNGGSDGNNGNGDYDNNLDYHRVLRVKEPFMKGEDVKKVQSKLNSLNYNVGSVDGVYGYATEEQVIRYQKAKGLSADGAVGESTWNSLMNSDSSGGGSSNEDYDTNAEYHRVLRVKNPLMRGEDVKKVQSKLNSLNYNVGSVDGAYGYGTEEQVIRFQQAKGLSADGAVGQNTWNSLMNSGSSGGGDDNGFYDPNKEYHRVLKISEPLMRGEDIKSIQLKLDSIGYKINKIDGIFGSGTLDAIIKFQEENGIFPIKKQVDNILWNIIKQGTEVITEVEFEASCNHVSRMMGFLNFVELYTDTRYAYAMLPVPGTYEIKKTIQRGIHFPAIAQENIQIYGLNNLMFTTTAPQGLEVELDSATKKLIPAFKFFNGNVYVKVISPEAYRIEFYKTYKHKSGGNVVGSLSFQFTLVSTIPPSLSTVASVFEPEVSYKVQNILYNIKHSYKLGEGALARARAGGVILVGFMIALFTPIDELVGLLSLLYVAFIKKSNEKSDIIKLN